MEDDGGTQDDEFEASDYLDDDDDEDNDGDLSSLGAPEGGDELPEEKEVLQETGELLQKGEMKCPAFTSLRPKIIQILKHLHSPEVKIYSEASKEFESLLRGDSGGEILCGYFELSPKFVELMEAWRLHHEKPGMAYILSLMSVILDHQDGKTQASEIGKNLDILARSIFQTKLDDIYAELNSKDSKRESAALDLLASIVRRGTWFAWQVERDFNFRFPFLSEPSRKQNKGQRKGRRTMKRSTRMAFVRFAMSFLEAGSPRLLRSILRKKEMYATVLQGIGGDDIDTICHVLLTLRDKVVTEDSLISPGLRSVLFGPIALEQLSYISGNPMAGHGADIAHQVLVMVCTDPRNGLMPDFNLKGNEKRLFELMKKLKATEVGHHRKLLLSIINKRPSLSAAYLDNFPYSLESFSSSSWFAAVSLAADVISTVNADTAIAPLSHHQSPIETDELYSIFKSIVPRACFRSSVKGLLHADILVKHGYLRLVWEFLKSMNNILMTVDNIMNDIDSIERLSTSEEEIANSSNVPGIRCFSRVNKFSGIGGGFHTDDIKIENLVSLRRYILDEVRGTLPDTQVLLALLSSLRKRNLLKRSNRHDSAPEVAVKRLKLDATGESLDIVVSGIDVASADVTNEEQTRLGCAGDNQELYAEKDHGAVVSEIWGLDKQKLMMNEPVDVQDFLYSKLLDVFTLYMRLTPTAFEGSFDFFSILPSDPLSLPAVCQQSLLSLLLEYSGQSLGTRASVRVPEFMYKHLQPLTNLLIYSEDEGIKNQAYLLARASLLSTGAFDQNLSEVDAWLLSLPGYSNKEHRAADAFQMLYTVVISFLSDAVSTVGNNLYKYLEHVHKLMSNLDNNNDDCPGFSPLVICVLQKCLRLIESDSGTFKLHERSMISLYVCNALNLILQSQVDVKLLASIINLVLNEKFVEDHKSSLCEWRPLKNLLDFAENLINQQRCTLFPVIENMPKRYNSLLAVYSKIDEFAGWIHAGREAEVALAISSSVICTSSDDILREFHLLLTIAQVHFSSLIPFLSYILFVEPKFLTEVAKLWPDIFIDSLEKMEKDGSSFDKYEFPQSTGISLSSDCLVSEESAAAFCLFLKHAPVSSLFSAFLCFGSYSRHSTGMINVLHSSNIIDLLKLKLSEKSSHQLVLFLRYVLFWAYQILLTYKAKPSDYLERLFLTCFALLDFIFEHLVRVPAGSTDSVTVVRSSVPPYIQDVLEIIFHHPLVTLVVSEPLSCSRTIVNEVLGNGSDMLLTDSTQALHIMDHCILQFVIKVLQHFSCSENGSISALKIPNAFCLVPKTYKHLIQKITLVFKEKFGICVQRRDSRLDLPYFHIFYSLMPFMSLFDLLEVVQWMLSKLEIDVSSCNSEIPSTITVCLNITDGALDILYSFFKRDNITLGSSMVNESRNDYFDSGILERVYSVILNLVLNFEMETAYKCLLKAVDFVCHQVSANPHPTILPFYMMLSRIVINSPIKLLTDCFCSTTKIKAKFLLLLIEVSPLHMRLFGHIFLGVLNKYSSAKNFKYLDGSCALKNKVDDKNLNYDFSEEDFVLLLPVALSYFTSSTCGHAKKDLKLLGAIPIFYSKILLKNFSNWKTYVSRKIFQEEYHELVVAAHEDVQNLLDGSLLGKAVVMLLYFFTLNSSSVTRKQRMEIFDSMYQNSDGLLDSDLERLYACSDEEKLKLINEISAKLSFTQLLLSSPRSLMQMFKTKMATPFEMASEKESKCLSCARLKFITILVNSLDQIVRTFPHKADECLQSSSSNGYYISRFLEHFILENIISLTQEVKSYLNQLPSVPFLNQFIRSCLLYRFEDPVTLKAIRCFLVALPEEKFSSSEVFDLLLGHSQFVSTILGTGYTSDPYALSLSETLLQPIPSVIKSLDACDTDSMSPGLIAMPIGLQKCDDDALEKRRLELIKLLRVVYHYRKREYNKCPENVDVGDLRELIFLLLSGYGATLREIDLEILHLIHEIETIKESEYAIVAEMEYLWGNSVLKLKKEITADGLASANLASINESVENRCKILFRENIPINSKLCVDTVLKFSYDRSSVFASMSLEKLLRNNFTDKDEISCLKGDKLRGYDPAFILHFAIHSLVMGFIEPVEFSRVGLLAIAFVSISSPEEELRKLGYEALGRFKLALEKCHRSEELSCLRILLTYLQNAITEPWEKIPSVVALFAAEASFILLDPKHDNFFAIRELLLHSPKANLKSVPLFKTYFSSSSKHFKRECLWILRLLYAGINLSDDAGIFRRNKILELLVSFHASSMPDDQSKVLILQILEKSIKLSMLADYMVMECGLFSWLCSVLLHYGHKLGDGQKESFLEIMQLVLKVANDLVARRTISEWLQEYALEQLSQLSSHLSVLFLDALKFLKQNVSLVNLILLLMASTLMISQKRNIYQPHYTVSLDGLCHLYKALDAEFKSVKYTLTNELGLITILMSSPVPVTSSMDKRRLLKLVKWAIPVSLLSPFKQRSSVEEPCLDLLYEEQQEKESLVSKLLRWVMASVILGSIQRVSYQMNTPYVFCKSDSKTLQSVLESIIRGDQMLEEDFSANDELAGMILHLFHLLRGNSSVFPSIISALCLLLVSGRRNIDNNDVWTSLCSKICCPVEVDPAWRWSFYQPCGDLGLQQTEVERLEEEQTCWSLLLMISNALEGKESGLPILSYKDLQQSGLFEWERNIFLQTKMEEQVDIQAVEETCKS